jgi:hypothetical protein
LLDLLVVCPDFPGMYDTNAFAKEFNRIVPAESSARSGLKNFNGFFAAGGVEQNHDTQCGADCVQVSNDLISPAGVLVKAGTYERNVALIGFGGANKIGRV